MRTTFMTVANFSTNCFLIINGQFANGIVILLFLMRILFIPTVLFLVRVISLLIVVSSLFVIGIWVVISCSEVRYIGVVIFVVVTSSFRLVLLVILKGSWRFCFYVGLVISEISTTLIFTTAISSAKPLSNPPYKYSTNP